MPVDLNRALDSNTGIRDRIAIFIEDTAGDDTLRSQLDDQVLLVFAGFDLERIFLIGIEKTRALRLRFVLLRLDRFEVEFSIGARSRPVAMDAEEKYMDLPQRLIGQRVYDRAFHGGLLLRE